MLKLKLVLRSLIYTHGLFNTLKLTKVLWNSIKQYITVHYYIMEIFTFNHLASTKRIHKSHPSFW